MFQFFINRAQRSIDTLVSRYVVRAVVAVPFIIAMGFGTAAASVKLTAEYGSMTAYTILAAAFSVVGLAAAAAIALSSPPAAPDAGPQEAASEAAASESAESTEPDLPMDPATVLSALATVGPTALPHLLRMLARNLPLVIGLAVLAYLLFADAEKEDVGADAADTVAEHS